jgi:hypothetical protein
MEDTGRFKWSWSNVSSAEPSPLYSRGAEGFADVAMSISRNHL